MQTQPSEVKHTPLPWKVGEIRFGGRYQLIETLSPSTGFVCEVQAPFLDDAIDDEGLRANAEFIVRACNSHYTLLEACRRALRERFGWDDPCVDLDPITNELRAAVEEAEASR